MDGIIYFVQNKTTIILPGDARGTRAPAVCKVGPPINVTLTCNFTMFHLFCLNLFVFSILSGIGVWTKHVRDGIELPEIARDDNYDFNFQVF